MSKSSMPAARPHSDRCKWTAAFAVLALSLSPTASPAQSGSITFEELEARLADHPSIAALRREGEAREELSTAERALPDPVVSLGVGSIPVRNPGFTREPDANKAIGVAQEIPNFGVRRARSARQKSEADAVAAQIAYKMAQLRADLIAALAEKRRAKEQLEFAEAQLKKYAQIQDILRGEVEAGRPVYYRLSEIDVERADVERSIVALGSSLAQTDASLVELVGEAPDNPPPAVTLTAWNGDALALHAARLADAGVDIAKAGVREGKAEFGPDFGLSFTYQQREDGIDAAGASFQGDDWFAAGVSVSIPLWAPKSQAPRLRAARARQAGAELSYQAVAREIARRLTSLHAEHAAAERNIALFERKAAAIDGVIAAVKRNYEAGNGDYAQALDAEIAKLTLLAELSAERANAIVHAAYYNSELVTP
jgi:outer membrane protein, heavy metal efflux system